MSVVLVERPSEGVVLIRINRPEQRNALNLETRKAIVAALEAAAADDTVRVAVITGDEKAFAAGADLKEMLPLGPVETMRRGIHTLWDRIAAFPKPLIAAVNGFALGGGCELALHCDIIVAGESAKFGLPETGVGILPGGSGTQRLTRAVGKYKAMWMVLTGEFDFGTGGCGDGAGERRGAGRRGRATRARNGGENRAIGADQRRVRQGSRDQRRGCSTGDGLEPRAQDAMAVDGNARQDGRHDRLRRETPAELQGQMIMTFDANSKSMTIAVIGTGTMGRGIVQVSAQGGMNVIAFDEKPGAAEAAKDYIAKMLGGQVEKGRVTAEERQATLGRIQVATKFEDVAKANVVIEAIIERLDIKQPLFAKLDALCGPDVILASNTSSLPVTAIAAKCRNPERVAGLHFFNPVPLMKLVEVIPGLRTAPWVSDALMTIGRRMTREPVMCVDSPGFIVNHAGRGIAEAQRILVENIATHAEIDRILTGAPGFKLGPYALADLVGMDVGHAVQESFFAQFFAEPAYAPNPLTALRVAGGLYGQKTNQGWYSYQDGKRVEPPVRPVPARSAMPVWMQAERASLRTAGAACGHSAKRWRRRSRPARSRARMPIILITPLGYDISTAVADLKLDGRRTVAVDVLFGMKGPRTLMVSPATSPAVRDAAHAMLACDGQPVIVINDSPGFVAQRVVAMIVNVGCQIAQRNIAVPADIDKAVKLGLGYPYGPLEWGDQIGPGRVLHHPRLPAEIPCRSALSPVALAEAARGARLAAVGAGRGAPK